MTTHEAGRQKLLIVSSLVALYFIWGSTYLAMRIAIESFAPFLMAAIRFSVAGATLYLFLRWRGSSAPTAREWLSATIVGTLLLAMGNAVVAYVEQSVSSGVAALAMATVPLWMAFFSGFWGHWPHAKEWSGIVVGILGVAVLSSGSTLQASPMGTFLLLFAAASFSFGSVWSKRLSMPAGAMSSATQMFAGGMVLMLMSVLHGESWPTQPTQNSILAIIYLITFGSLVAYSAYLFLLQTVRPALASSNAFVNPVVAVFLGVWLAGEHIGTAEYMALGIIIIGVLLVLPFKLKE